MSGFWRVVGGKRWGGLVLSCSLLAGAGATPVGQRALADANHFLGYYRALDRASSRCQQLAFIRWSRPDRPWPPPEARPRARYCGVSQVSA